MPRRRVRQLILVLYAAALVGMAGMVIGPFLNDRTIGANPGRALATVTDVGTLRTFVDFQDSKGIYHTPPTGLLYPTRWWRPPILSWWQIMTVTSLPALTGLLRWARGLVRMAERLWRMARRVRFPRD